MPTARVLLRRTLRLWTVRRARRQLRELETVALPAGPRLSAALSRALDGSASSEQDAWFDRIEELRSRLELDDSTVTITDFGAGSSHDVRTDVQMAEGVQVTKSLRQVSRASKPAFWARLLHELVREYRPRTALEMGTCLGISAAYQAAALEMEGAGQLTTLEGAASLAEVSRDNLDRCGLGHRVDVVTGRFADTLESILETLPSIDYAFVDGHHDENATVAYFEQLLPHLADPAVLVFDDIDWTPGMRRAWAQIASSPRVGLAVDLRAIGICIIDSSVVEPSRRAITTRCL